MRISGLRALGFKRQLQASGGLVAAAQSCAKRLRDCARVWGVEGLEGRGFRVRDSRAEASEFTGSGLKVRLSRVQRIEGLKIQEASGSPGELKVEGQIDESAFRKPQNSGVGKVSSSRGGGGVFAIPESILLSLNATKLGHALP